MTHDSFLRSALAAVEVNDGFTEAIVVMEDQSRLRFHHSVDERWVKAEEPGDEKKVQGHLAGQVLEMIAMFRLNTRHLDVQLADGSRWEARW